MNRRLLFAVLPPLFALAVGCGPRYSRGVPKELMEKLPYETRIELLEAENDLAIAVDKLDEAHNEVSRTRDSIRRARDRRGSARDEEGRARDDLSRTVAKLAIDEAEYRVDYLRARQEANVKAEEAEEIAFRCAYARYEASRLATLRKGKIQGSEKLKQEDFDKQVKDCETELVELKKRAKDESQKADKVKTEWEVRKSALAKKTFDARASPFVE